MAVRLIRKQARGFRVGEWLYLFECYDAYDGKTLRGPYLITEVKHHTESTVTFMTKPIRHVYFGQVYSGIDTVVANSPHGTYVAHGHRMFEFSRDAELHRLAGEPVTFVVQENEFT
jgi:hypothetical protein